jgi:hypothetical protein
MTVEECQTGSELKRSMQEAIDAQVKAGAPIMDPKQSPVEHQKRLDLAKEAAFKAESDFIKHRNTCPACVRIS